MGLELELKQKQELSLSPQLLQAIQILQMNTYELRNFILHELQENPVLEAERTSPPYEDAMLLARKLEWLDGRSGRRSRLRGGMDEPVTELAERLTTPLWEDTLEAHLTLQFSTLKLNREEERCARFLIQCVDDRGYLDEDAEETSERLGIPLETVSRVLDILRTLDPPGICARNLKECLAAQLKDYPDRSTAIAIIEGHLENLARGHYAAIAKCLGLPLERVTRACEKIRKLDPCPGSAFTQGAPPVYIMPDVIVKRTENGFDVTLNDHILPDLALSGYYVSLLKSSDNSEVRGYLAERVQRARWLISSVEQRRGTLLTCAKAIVDLQAPFFRGERETLAPMVLSDVAERVGMHTSTVSRAIRDKYLQYDGNVCAIKSLFSRGLGSGDGGRSSADLVRAAIRRLIEREDKKRPLSDQQLCGQLAREGIELSRRTVAKYRDELGIPGTAARRER